LIQEVNNKKVVVIEHQSDLRKDHFQEGGNDENLSASKLSAKKIDED